MKFIPHDYQEYAVQFITDHKESLLLLDMGLGRQNRHIIAGNYEPDV